MMISIDTIDTENRQTLCEMTLADPLSGELVRNWLEMCPDLRGWSPERTTLELICWLVLIREACGIEGIGHA